MALYLTDYPAWLEELRKEVFIYSRYNHFTEYASHEAVIVVLEKLLRAVIDTRPADFEGFCVKELEKYIAEGVKLPYEWRPDTVTPDYVLKHSPFFSTISPELFNSFLQKLVPVTFSEGETISAEDVYVLMQGSLDVEQPDGKHVPLDKPCVINIGPVLQKIRQTQTGPHGVLEPFKDFNGEQAGQHNDKITVSSGEMTGYKLSQTDFVEVIGEHYYSGCAHKAIDRDSVKFMSALPAIYRRQLLNMAHIRTLDAGDEVYRGGERADKLFVVEDGTVVQTRGDQRRTTDTAQGPFAIGLEALRADTYGDTCRTGAITVLYEIATDTLRKALPQPVLEKLAQWAEGDE